MKLSDYQLRAPGFCSSMSPLVDAGYQTQWYNFQLLLAAIGAVGEAVEVLEACINTANDKVLWSFARPRIWKEYGDVLWYLALACAAAGIDIESCAPDSDEIAREYATRMYPEINELAVVLHAEQLAISAKTFSEYVKKGIFHFHGMTQEALSDLIAGVLLQLGVGCLLTETTLEAVAELNINKLSARYSQGSFDSEESKNRKEGDE